VVSDLTWTTRAQQEADAWIDWVKHQNPKVATKAVMELIARTAQLQRFHALGRIGFVDGTRELSLPKWKKVVVYRITEIAIEILTLRDTRQNRGV
jgi:plasmid stabilization system protein ParE